MLNWSTNKIKLTFGIGAMGMLVSVLSAYDLPVQQFWLLSAAVGMPFVIFVLIHPYEGLSNKIVRRAHLLGVVWYLIAATITIALTYGTEPMRKWLLGLAFIGIGLIPCFFVLRSYWVERKRTA